MADTVPLIKYLNKEEFLLCCQKMRKVKSEPWGLIPNLLRELNLEYEDGVNCIWLKTKIEQIEPATLDELYEKIYAFWHQRYQHFDTDERLQKIDLVWADKND